MASSYHVTDIKSFGNESSPWPRLSFAEGTLLVMLVIVVASALFLCCYHWAKLVNSAITAQERTSAVEPAAAHKIFMKVEPLPKLQSPPVVYMPGEDMPTFIALPSPYGIEATLEDEKETHKREACSKAGDVELNLEIRQ